jgi:Predicted xylanase/chitin deacetylase
MVKNIDSQMKRLLYWKLTLMGYSVFRLGYSGLYVKRKKNEKTGAYADNFYLKIRKLKAIDGSQSRCQYDEKQEEIKRAARIIYQGIARNIKKESDHWDYSVVGKESILPCTTCIDIIFVQRQIYKDLKESPEHQEQFIRGIAEGIDFCYHPRTMYLTFDDGPSKENTYKVLKVLNKRGIKATFFLIGIYVKWYPDIARQIVRDGHAIGIHCYIHDYDVIYRSVDDYIDDFEKAHQIIKEVLGIEPKIFRFPGGSGKEICKDIAAEMEKRGYIFYDWNAGLGDAVIEPKPEELIDNAVESAHSNGKDKEIIMLAHDRVYATGECLDELLDRLPGYQMKLLSEAVEPVQFVKRL